VLLLSGETLELEPVGTEGFVPVGEEKLPEGVRSRLSARVAAGFQHVGAAPPLTVRVVPHVAEVARFDAQSASLLTIDEGALHGQVAVDVTVKSGRIKELLMRLDPGSSVLEVVAPSLLRFTTADEAGRPVVTASFSEALEGTVRVTVTFERILARDVKRLDLTPLDVLGADVQRGHVAIASSAALEIATLELDDVQEVTSAELPVALASATRSPILMAYAYSHLPARFAIGVTGHAAVKPADSRIASAAVETTLSAKGNLVTRARYLVTNPSRQFLRLALPEGAEPWDVLVAGAKVRPAQDPSGQLIIPLPRSEASFPVELSYSVERPAFGFAGRLAVEAPKADLFVEALDWSLELPAGYRLHGLSSNLEIREPARHASRLELSRRLISPADDAPRVAGFYVARGTAKLVDAAALLLSLALVAAAWRARVGFGRRERIASAVAGAGAIALVLFGGAHPATVVLPLVAALLVFAWRTHAARQDAQPA
jgi:hypothetical protein